MFRVSRVAVCSSDHLALPSNTREIRAFVRNSVSRSSRAISADLEKRNQRNVCLLLNGVLSQWKERHWGGGTDLASRYVSVKKIYYCQKRDYILAGMFRVLKRLCLRTSVTQVRLPFLSRFVNYDVSMKKQDCQI